MANLFDAANAPSKEPTDIVVGDFVQWKRADIASDYPTSEGFTAEYVARMEKGGVEEFKVSQDAGSTDDYYLFSISSSTSATFFSGTYNWQLEITQASSGNRIVVDTGSFQIDPDMDSDGADGRSHAQIMVDKIESLLQGKADSDVSSYSIAGRSLTKLSFQELVDARDYYRREATQEKTKELIKQGKSSGSTIQVRF